MWDIESPIYPRLVYQVHQERVPVHGPQPGVVQSPRRINNRQIERLLSLNSEVAAVDVDLQTF